MNLSCFKGRQNQPNYKSTVNVASVKKKNQHSTTAAFNFIRNFNKTKTLKKIMRFSTRSLFWFVTACTCPKCAVIKRPPIWFWVGFILSNSRWLALLSVFLFLSRPRVSFFFFFAVFLFFSLLFFGFSFTLFAHSFSLPLWTSFLSLFWS